MSADGALGRWVRSMWFLSDALADTAAPFLPIESVAWDVSVTGPIARVHVVERFRNTGHDPVDALLVAPVAPGGAVTALRLTIGTRVIEGVIEGRDDARAAFEAARDEGRNAALAEQVRPDVFTLDVANVPPGVPVEVHLTLYEPVTRVPGGFQVHVPADTPPRFLPLGADPVVPTIGPGDRDVGVRAKIDVSVQAGVPLRSLSGPAPDVFGSVGRVALRDRPLGERVVVGWLTTRSAPTAGLLVTPTHAMVAVEGGSGALDDATCPLVDTVEVSVGDGARYLVGRRAGGCAGVTVDGLAARAVEAADPRAIGATWAQARIPGLMAAGDRAGVRDLGLQWGMVTSETSLVAVDPVTPRVPARSPTGSASAGFGALGGDVDGRELEGEFYADELNVRASKRDYANGALARAKPKVADAEDEKAKAEKESSRPSPPPRDAKKPPRTVTAEPAADEPDFDEPDAAPVATDPYVDLADQRRADTVATLEAMLSKAVPDEARYEMQFRLAVILAEGSDPTSWERAAKLFRTVAERGPDGLAERAYLQLALVLRRLGRDAEADAALAKRRARFPAAP